MTSPSTSVAISEAEERVAEPQGAEQLAVRVAKGGLWPALHRRAGEILSRWMEQQAAAGLYSGGLDET